MPTIRAWHATSADFERFAPFSHFGSRTQAEMRRTRGGRLLEVEFILDTIKTLKDTGSWKAAALRSLERRGYDGIQYLNRFESIPLEAFDRARAKYGNIDSLSDHRFRLALPEAAESWIVFDPLRIKIINIVEAPDHSTLRSNLDCSTP